MPRSKRPGRAEPGYGGCTWRRPPSTSKRAGAQSTRSWRYDATAVAADSHCDRHSASGVLLFATDDLITAGRRPQDPAAHRLLDRVRSLSPEFAADPPRDIPGHGWDNQQGDLERTQQGLEGQPEGAGQDVRPAGEEHHPVEAKGGGTERGPQGKVPRPVQKIVVRSVPGEALFKKRPRIQHAKGDAGHKHPGKERVGDGVMEQPDFKGGHNP